LPNFIGRWFPKQDDPEQLDAHCAAMLVLLKPWRCLETDLKGRTETWTQALTNFLADDDGRNQHIISGIQFFYQTKATADRLRDSEMHTAGDEGENGRDIDDEDQEYGDDEE
ncbi:hypothetical protein EV361DRAFT_758776, partial [Lentinula raphanica]